MKNEHDDLALQIKALEKENKILKRKFERSNNERVELETHLAQTRKLLQTVAQEHLTEAIQKQLTVFRKFVPQEFLQSLKKEDWLDIKLGDHVEYEMTVLFTDIRSFTSLSEQMSIEDNFGFINSYLHYVYPPIKQHEGFVDKFIGDAIMALFYKSQNAIEASIGIRRALESYNEEYLKPLGRLPIDIGIGLHRGNLMLGVIGVEQRMQTTVISDAVNLASRLESLTKLYGSALLVSHNVLMDHGDLYPTRFLGKVKVVGKNQEIEIYEILAAESEEIRTKKIACKTFFEEGLNLYFAKKFAEASVQFTQSLKIYPEDKAAQLYLRNAAIYMVNGVADNWDGVEVFKEK